MPPPIIRPPLALAPSTEEARRHYDEMTQANMFSKRQRRALPTIPIRDFNNALKSAVISSMKQHTTPGCRILDLCCGRGGDLFKLRDLSPSKVVFVDIARNSLEEAQRRYSRGRRDVPYEAQFVQSDCFSTQLIADIGARQAPFDVIMCNFAVHYAFADERMATTFFANVEALLKPRTGRLILVYPQFEALRSYACADTDVWWNSFGNDVFSVTIPPRTLCGEERFGQAYRFSLDHAVSNCEEFLVPPETLRTLAKEFGLVAEWTRNFLDYAYETQALTRFIPHDAQFRTVCSLYAVAVYRSFAEDDDDDNDREEENTPCNYIPLLQTWCQRRRFALPVYHFSFVGDATQQMFSCTLSVDMGDRIELVVSDRAHASKAAAKRNVAALMYRRLVEPLPHEEEKKDEVHDDDEEEEVDSMLTQCFELTVSARSSLEQAEAVVFVDDAREGCVELEREHPRVAFLHFVHTADTTTSPSSSHPPQNVLIHDALSNTASALMVAVTRLVDRCPTLPIFILSRNPVFHDIDKVLRGCQHVTTRAQLAQRLLGASAAEENDDSLAAASASSHILTPLIDRGVWAPPPPTVTDAHFC